MRSSNEEVMRNLEDRRNRLAIECDKAHRAWRDSEDATGTFDKWTAAIEELNETEQALILMRRIITKEEKHNETKKEVMEVVNLEDAEMFDQFIIYDEESQQWDMTTYELLQHNNVRPGDHYFTLKNLKNGNVFPSYLNPLNPIHIVKKAAE